MGQFRYTIVHIPGARNVWGDLLSRWVKIGKGPRDDTATVRCIPILSMPHDEFPDKQIVREATIPTKFGVAQPDKEGMYRVPYRG